MEKMGLGRWDRVGEVYGRGRVREGGEIGGKWGRWGREMGG